MYVSFMFEKGRFLDERIVVFLWVVPSLLLEHKQLTIGKTIPTWKILFSIGIFGVMGLSVSIEPCKRLKTGL